MPWTAANPVARLSGLGIGVLLAALAPSDRASADALASPQGVAAWVGEASLRFALPPALITGVMRRESGFKPLAVSPAGALGLMQVMPSTYQALRQRYGLGPDALAPRDNVLAGAAYLRELYDRFGADGFLAAYNAGPTRYLHSLIDGAPLPAETRRYVDRLQLDLGLADVSTAPPTLFVSLSPAASTGPAWQDVAPSDRAAGGGLFAPIRASGGEAGHGR